MIPQDLINVNSAQNTGLNLPTWTAAVTAPSTSIFGKLLYSIGSTTHMCDKAASVIKEALSFSGEGMVLPRLLWMAQIPNPEEIYMATFTVSGETPISLVECKTQLELLMSTVPSYAIDQESKALIFRNLAQIEEELAPDASHVYTLTASGIILDEPIFIKVSDTFYQLPEYIIDKEVGTISTGESSGNITVRYSTNARLLEITRGIVAINSAGSFGIECLDAWNLFDEQGLLSYTSRLKGETNQELLRKIGLAYSASLLETPSNNKFSLTNELCQLQSCSWNTTGALTINADGEIKEVVVVGLPQNMAVEEVLVTDAEHKVFYGSYRDWQPRFYVHKDNVALNDDLLGITAASGVLTSPIRLDGEIKAFYGITTYEIEYDGNSATLTPTLNTPGGLYSVLYAIDVSLEVPDILDVVAGTKKDTSYWGPSAEWLISELNSINYEPVTLI